MRVDDFNFELPREAIAERPANPRDSARLLRVRTGAGGASFEDRTIRDLPDLLAPHDILVSNDTRVIPARLKGKRGTAGIEVTLHQKLGPTAWKAFARPAKKLSAGDRIDFGEGFWAQVADKGDMGEITLSFGAEKGDLDGETALMAALERVGSMPLPPYIRGGKADAQDAQDYQTIFAVNPGAVAAPTAGLHFTPQVLNRLAAKGVEHVTVTLHVGAGTFLPVKVDDTRDHRMHSEIGTVTESVAARINRARALGGRVVAVGTTSARLLESAADADGVVHPFCAATDIFITPGYRFKAVDVLLTNFHLPRSTLFMLVSAFSGLDTMKAAYAHALAQGYRFYSYGDACLLERTHR
jgi:S-adenosylmethionine:tRNA ribosyltransferase-isomerase